MPEQKVQEAPVSTLKCNSTKSKPVTKIRTGVAHKHTYRQIDAHRTDCGHATAEFQMVNKKTRATLKE